jgi:hypothetical protein
MDFIERLFHVSPDSSSGSIELLLVAIACLVVATLFLNRRRLPSGS